jgi:hypothetical protein
MVYLDASFLRIDWDKDLRCVSMEYKDVFVEGEEYRSVLRRVLDLVEEKRCSRLLADGRKMKIITPEDQAWVEKDWLPRSKRAGLRHSALILPKSIVSTLAVNRIMERFTSAGGKEVEIIRAYFEDVPSARAWLRSVPD